MKKNLFLFAAVLALVASAIAMPTLLRQEAKPSQLSDAVLHSTAELKAAMQKHPSSKVIAKEAQQDDTIEAASIMGQWIASYTSTFVDGKKLGFVSEIINEVDSLTGEEHLVLTNLFGEGVFNPQITITEDGYISIPCHTALFSDENYVYMIEPWDDEGNIIFAYNNGKLIAQKQFGITAYDANTGTEQMGWYDVATELSFARANATLAYTYNNGVEDLNVQAPVRVLYGNEIGDNSKIMVSPFVYFGRGDYLTFDISGNRAMATDQTLNSFNYKNFYYVSYIANEEDTVEMVKKLNAEISDDRMTMTLDNTWTVADLGNYFIGKRWNTSISLNSPIQEYVSEAVNKEYYLVGEFNGWMFDDQYKFTTTDGMNYELKGFTLPAYCGFKISTNNWEYNFGTCNSQLSLNRTIDLAPDGCNMYVNEDALVNVCFNAVAATLVLDTDVKFDWMVVDVANPNEFAQTYLDITNNDWSAAKYLKVTGKLSATDLKNMSNLTNLIKLDISEIALTDLPSSFMSSNYTLEEVKLPSTLVNIGTYAFNYCRNLATVEFVGENNIATIGNNAFCDCHKLITFDISKVKSIGSNAFSNCYNFCPTSAASATTIGSSAFSQCGITEITPDFFNPAITALNGSLFYGCQGLSKVELPATITYLNSSVFSNCRNLTEIILPETLTYIGSSAFYQTGISEITIPEAVTSMGYSVLGYCNNLTTVKSKSATPPTLDGEIINGLDATYIDLYVPGFSKNAYRDADYWNSFFKVRSLLEPVSLIKVTHPVAIDVAEEDSAMLVNKPRIELSPLRIGDYNYENQVGQLTITGEGTLSASVIDVYPSLNPRNYGRDYYYTLPTLINEADKMRTDSLAVHMVMYKSRWHFITLPFDVKVSEIIPNEGTYWAIRKYDSAARAAADGSATWIDLTNDDIMEAGKGYIVNCYNSDNRPMLTFPAQNNVNKNNIFRSTNVTVELEEYEAEFAHNRSWNLVGNPYPAFVDIHSVETPSGEAITAPITIWRGSSYQAYSPLDDELVLRPYESFFVQRPLDEGQFVFTTEGRLHYSAVYNGDAAYVAPNRDNVADGREVFDFNISCGDATNRARIVINEEATEGYDLGRDAAKFFTVENGSPLIYVTADQNYEICERPLADCLATLGLQISKEGMYTISLSGRHSSDWHVWLIDTYTGASIDLMSDEYTFNADQMSDSDRFVVRFENEVDGIESVELEQIDANAEVTVCNMAGQVLYNGRKGEMKQPAQGVYLFTVAGATVKVAVK